MLAFVKCCSDNQADIICYQINNVFFFSLILGDRYESTTVNVKDGVPLPQEEDKSVTVKINNNIPLIPVFKKVIIPALK